MQVRVAPQEARRIVFSDIGRIGWRFFERSQFVRIECADIGPDRRRVLLPIAGVSGEDRERKHDHRNWQPMLGRHVDLLPLTTVCAGRPSTWRCFRRASRGSIGTEWKKIVQAVEASEAGETLWKRT